MPFLLPVVLAGAMLLLGGGSSRAEILELHRGVSIHEWLNWSPLTEEGTYVSPPYRGEQEWLAGYRPLTDWPPGDVFTSIRNMGFDFVRLTVDPGPLVADGGARRGEALEVISAALDRITAGGLAVVLDLHAVGQVPRYGMDFIMGGAASANVAAYQEMVGDVAGMIVRQGSGRVALEPFNEPSYYPCDTGGTGEWNTIMAATVARIRAVSTGLTVVVTGGCGGNVSGLADLDPQDDPNLYYSFHMYEPHAFTHQGLGEGEFLSGLPWPAASGRADAVIQHLLGSMSAAGLDDAQQVEKLNASMQGITDYFDQGWGESQLTARFGEALQWAKAQDIPTQRLFLGEFNATLMSGDGSKGAFEPDRSRYVEAVRREAETLGIPWAVWEFSNPFGMSVIERDGPALPDGNLLRALGLGG